MKFSFAVSLVISFLFLLITFWIFYSYSWSAEAAKDALSTTGSFYGAAATLGAAIIAAYLFNDWRDQHKAGFYAAECKEILNEYRAFIQCAQKLKGIEIKLKDIMYPFEDKTKIKHASFLTTQEKSKINDLSEDAIDIKDQLSSVFNNINNTIYVLNQLKQDKNLSDSTSLFLKSAATNLLPLFDYKAKPLQPYEMYKTLGIVNTNLSNVIDSGKGLIADIKRIGDI